MSPTADKIYEQIMSFSDEERAELPHEWASAEVEAAWDDEIHRRVAAANRGEIPTLSQEEVDVRLKAKYGFLAE